MKVKIIRKNLKPFSGKDGEMIDYAWYRAVDLKNDLQIEFGSSDVTYEKGDEVDVNLVKYENSRGGISRKEVRE